MVTKRYIQRDGKTFGPYYYESYRDHSGKVKKRYLKDYTPQKENKNLMIILLLIGLLAVFFLIFLLLNQEYSHRTLTERAIYEAKEIYAPGEPLTGDILFNLRQGESIPKDTRVSISLGDFQEEFILSDFVDYDPIEGTIYAENSELSGEGMIFGIPGIKKSYQEVEFELEIYTEQEIEEPSEEPTQETPESTETPVEESQESPQESPPEKTPPEASPITGEVISETIITTISGKTSKDNPFTHQLEEGQKVRIVEGSVKSNSEVLSENEISLNIENNVLTVTTEYALEEEGFGEEFLGDENAMTFKINIEDLGLQATTGELIIEISYDGKQIAYYEDTILVSETEIVEEELPPTLTQTQEIPSIRIPFNENVVIDLQDYFAGATYYSAQIENIQVNIEGSLMQLTPDPEFKGARKAKILAGNEKETLESNEFLILVSSGAVTIKTTREKIKVGQPVKWKKEITKKQAEEKINIEIPREAENVEVKAIVADQEEIIEVIDQVSPITGEVVIEVNLDQKNQRTKLNTKFLKSFKTWFASFKAEFNKKLQLPQMTGKAIEEISAPEVVDITLADPSATDYVIEYETPAPEAIEEPTEEGKIITISAPSEYGYTDVIAFTELDNTIPITRQDRIKLYWYNYEHSSLTQEEIQEAKTTTADEVPEVEVVEEISTAEESPVLTGEVVSTTEVKSPDYVKEEVVFDAYDLDFDGSIDYIEWVVPHLSNQTYEIIIEITNAEHLDENRTFISDIFANVSELDNIWSETIPENHYVRVTFETELNSNNDITLYPRTVNGTPQIEVYEENSSELVATFSSLIDNQYNKVYLIGLQNPQKTFDLKILNGSIEIDHIIDPTDGAPRVEFAAGTSQGTQENNEIFINLSTEDMSTHYAFVDFNNDTLLWMRMDDVNSSGDPTDISRYSNNGSKQGDATQTSVGYFGQGFSFDGAGDYVSLAAQGGLHYNGGEMTITAWINPKTATVNDGIVKRGQSNSASSLLQNYMLGVYTNNRTLFLIGNSTNDNYVLSSTNAIKLDQWNFIACGINSTALYCYVNGVSNGTTTRTMFSNYYSADNTTMIGAQRTSDNYFNGTIDEVLIFNRSLSQQEILALYNASVYKYYNNFTNLANGVYSFQGFAVDAAGNKNQTELRTVTITTDATPPSINFTYPTPTNSSTLNNSSILVNLTTSDSQSDHYAFVDFDRDVVLWMRMDDVNASGDPTDLSTYSNNGSKQGDATQTSVGYFEEGFSFDGNRDFIEVATMANADPFDVEGLTVSAWIKTTTNATRPFIASRDTQLVSSWSFSMNYNNRRLFFDDGTGEVNSNSNAWTPEVWTHVAVTVNSTTVTFYSNGSIVGTDVGTHTISNNDNSLEIGLQTALLGSVGFNGTIDEVLIFNRSLSQQEILALYNASVYKYYNNFTNLANGVYSFQGFAVDAAGNKNQTELRTVTIDTSVSTTLPPSIEFVQPTPNDGELTDNSNLTIAVNVTTYNSTTLSVLRYRLYNSSIILINETYTTELNLTFAGLTPDTYFYNVWVNDSAGNNDTTSDRSIIILPSCFNLSTQCIEDDVCNIEENCYLHSEICTDNDCNFTIMITNATIYTLYDDNGNGRDLKLTLTSNTQRSPLTFLSGATIYFSGRKGSDIGSGSSGGSGGILNITVPDLLNLTNAEFIGRGGYNSLAISGVSGDGGHVVLNFHGLIQNYSNDPAPAPAPDLTKGDSIPGGAYGSDGTLTYNKDLETCPRDADVTGDGMVGFGEISAIKNNYNKEYGESGFSKQIDINCNSHINVVELSRVGFEMGTRSLE